MQASDVLLACKRRWYVVLPLLALTALAAALYYALYKPIYYSNSVIGVASPNQQLQWAPDGAAIERNGLIDSGGPTLIMNMVVMGFDNRAIHERVAADGGSPDFTVQMLPSAPGSSTLQAQLPIIMIEATDHDAARASRTIQLAAAQTDTILIDLQRQAGVSPSLMVKAIQAAKPSVIKGTPGRSKRTVAILALGCALAILVGVVVDAFRDRAAGRRPSDSSASSDRTPETFGSHDEVGDNSEAAGSAAAAAAVES